MNLIIIGSYLNVPCVIDIVEREKRDFKILSTEDSLLDLFAELYGREKVYKIPKVFKNFGNLKVLLSDFFRSFQHKKKLIKEIGAFQPKNLFFFFLGWNGLASWVIKEFSLICNIYYRPKVNVDLLQTDKSCRMQIKTAIASAVCGTRLRSGKYYGYSLIAVDKRFLEKARAREYLHEIDHRNIKKFLSKRFDNLQKIKVMILNGGMYNVEKDEYVRIMKLVSIVLFKKYKAFEICIKDHPHFPVLELEPFDECFKVPIHFPASLLCYHCDVVVGYSSATLFEAANLGKKPISLVKFIPTTKPSQVKEVIDYLEDHVETGVIEYPADASGFARALERKRT